MSQIYGSITYCPVFLPKTKFCQYSQKTFSKQNLNFSRSALFHMQIRVFLKYFVRTCSNLVGIVFANVALLFYTTSREYFKFLAQRISNFILEPSPSFHSVFFFVFLFCFFASNVNHCFLLLFKPENEMELDEEIFKSQWSVLRGFN